MRNKIIWMTLIIVILLMFFYIQNNLIGVTRLELYYDKLPDNFNEFRIIQISDLHSKWFGKGHHRLLKILDKSKPDIIVITGDLIDSKRYDEKSAIGLVTGSLKIAPVYFVTGNHEWWSGKFDSLEKRLKEAGVILLRNTSKELEKDGQKIYIAGLDDPASSASLYDEDSYVAKELLDTLSPIPQSSFKILLSHRPEHLLQYSGLGVDLVLSGHAHGGQFRIPFIGGLIAPDQGFFPKYTSGIYRDKTTAMVVSRGLGNSIIPQRIFNRPEVVEVILKK